MIKRTIVLLLVTSLLVYIQTTFLNQLAFNSVKPDIALIALVFIGVRYGSTQGAIVGFMTGLMEDFISLSPLGFHSFILTLIGFVAGLGGSWVSTESKLFQFVSLISATFVKYLVAAILISIYSITQSANPLVNSVFLIELIYNALLAPIIFFAGTRIDSIFNRKL